MLQLLQHRVRQAGGEVVAAQHQHRQPVGMGQCRRRQKVRRSRPGRGGADHEPPPQMRLGVGRRRKAHALFILAAIKRQLRPRVVPGLAQRGGVAVAEDAEAAAADALLVPVDLNELGRQPADDRLRHRQAQRRHGFCRLHFPAHPIPFPHR
jgi:hypothetical protein